MSGSSARMDAFAVGRAFLGPFGHSNRSVLSKRALSPFHRSAQRTQSGNPLGRHHAPPSPIRYDNLFETAFPLFHGIPSECPTDGRSLRRMAPARRTYFPPLLPLRHDSEIPWLVTNFSALPQRERPRQSAPRHNLVESRRDRTTWRPGAADNP